MSYYNRWLNIGVTATVSLKLSQFSQPNTCIKNGTFRYVIKYCLGKLECECNLNQNPYERCPPSCDGITEENSIICAID